MAGMFYVVFWCLVGAMLLPGVPALRIALGVLLLTCALEVMQLWQPPFLQRIRGTFLGMALLGTTFQASDFVYYLAGWAIGWAWIPRLRRG